MDRGSIANYIASVNPGGDNVIWTNGQEDITGAKANAALVDLAETVDGVKADKQVVTPGVIGSSTDTTGDEIIIPYIVTTGQGVISGYGTKRHTIPFTTFTNYEFGVNTGVSLASIPVTKRICLATISANVSTVALNGTLEEGHEVHVIIYNSSASDVTVTLSGSYTVTGDITLQIEGHGYGEINFVKADGTVYVRSSAGGGGGGGNDKQDEVVIETTIPNTGMVANVMYSLGTLTANKTVTLAADTSGYYRQYMLDCTCGATAYQITFPGTVKWQGGSAPTFEANKSYQVIIDTLGKGVFMEF